MEVRPPQPAEMEAYFDARWQSLRQPLGMKKGTEQDELEDQALHMCAIENGQILGVARAHEIDAATAQIRYMGVLPNTQGKGIGRKLVSAIEQTLQPRRVILNAREEAVGFYERLGYTVYEKGEVLLGSIQHYWMEKHIP